jgi:hypothetical protein
MRVAIVVPVFEDWASFNQLVFEVDHAFSIATDLPDIELDVLAVDDGSVSNGLDGQPDWSQLAFIGRVEVLRMAVNMGHQRAIALGGVHVADRGLADAVIFMDADGEDKPEDVIRLVKAHFQSPHHVIMALRARRSESVGFRIGYRAYRALFRILTGQGIQFGNFSLLPRPALARLVCSSDIWNHFAAAISRSRLGIKMIPTSRGKRFAGESKMSLVSLIIHGLSAMSVHADRVAIRLIVASTFTAVLSFMAILWVVGVKVFTDLAIPGWASQTVGLLALASMQGLATASLAAFLTLQARQRLTFLPRSDGARYIVAVETWHTRSQ